MTCEQLIAAYLKELQSGFTCKKLENNRLAIVTPFLYPDHDHVEIFVKDQGDNVVVHDYGETLRRLDITGMNIHTSDTFAFQASHIAKGFGVEISDSVLLKRGLKSEVGSLAHDVISACKTIGDLVFTGRGYQPQTFHTEVEKYLRSNRVKFESNFPQKSVKTGTLYLINFKVVASEHSYYMQAQKARTKGGVKKWVNSTYRMWSDLDGKKDVAKNISLVNDEGDEALPKEDVKLLNRVSEVHYWSEKNKLLQALKN